jgi:hypothetical protein
MECVMIQEEQNIVKLVSFYSIDYEYYIEKYYSCFDFWSLGTDCQDCGPVGADNFTRSDDDGWWDDDDDYWTFNDGNMLGMF